MSLLNAEEMLVYGQCFDIQSVVGFVSAVLKNVSRAAFSESDYGV